MEKGHGWGEVNNKKWLILSVRLETNTTAITPYEIQSSLQPRSNTLINCHMQSPETDSSLCLYARDTTHRLIGKTMAFQMYRN